MNPDAHLTPRRLMVVDNDQDLVDSLCEWVGLRGDWLAVPAYGPEDAIAQVEATPPDAILLDMEMLGADGFETAERLSKASGQKHSVLLALTGNDRLRDAAALDCRFAAALLKPADPGGLLTLLEALPPGH